MQLSLKVILAPVLGAIFGWLAAHGLNLSADQQAAGTTLIMTVLGSWLTTIGGHVWHEKSQAADASKSTDGKQGGFVVWEFLALCVVIPLVCLLLGCQSLGLNPATNVQTQIAYGYSGVTAALTTLAQATAAGFLTSGEATEVNHALLTIKTGLDQANQAVSSNQGLAASLLASATRDLATVSAYVTCKQQRSVSCQLSLS